MNEAKQYTTEFLWRRLEDPPELFGFPLDFDPVWWLGLGLPLLAAALVFVFWTYQKEIRSVGRMWAAFLSTQRTLALVAIFIIWLLPAVREVEWTEQRSKVLVLSDVSASMHTSDSPTTDTPGRDFPTRQDLVLKKLLPLGKSASNSEIEASPGLGGIFAQLAGKNPLSVYRFGGQLDDTPIEVLRPENADDFIWSDFFVPKLQPGLFQPLFGKTHQEIDIAHDKLKGLEELDEESRELIISETLAELDKTTTQDGLLRGRLLDQTNIGDALLRALRRESGDLLQAVVLVSDGRGNVGSSGDVSDALALAEKNGVPVFTVAVGSPTESRNLRIVDLLAPAQVLPEDEYPVRIVVEGENLDGNQRVQVALTIERPDSPPDKPLIKDISLTEKSAGIWAGSTEYRIQNEEKLEGDWKFHARVTPIEDERARADNQTGEPAIVQVTPKKPSVLLFAGGPMRDYQFLRTLLFREPDKFNLTIFLQGPEKGVVQDVDPRRLLSSFPDKLQDTNEDPLNLGNYDVIVAFDPDWAAEEVPASARSNLRRWVEDFSGGLIFVAGPVHTFGLASNAELADIRALLPVELDKSANVFEIMDRSSEEPWALNWGPTASQLNFLDLRDDTVEKQPLRGWEEFFDVRRDTSTGAALGPAKRGFYSFFPLQGVKPAASVIARYSDEFLTNDDNRQPYMALHTIRKGQVFYLGSGEIWRLRQFEEKYHERFWTKLIRHMGRGDVGRGSRRGNLLVGRRYFEGDAVEVEAELLDSALRPLTTDEQNPVLLKITPPPGSEENPAWNEGLPMSPISGRPGWFLGRFQVRQPGTHQLSITIPGSLESLNGSFAVERIDPERDQTRPDYGQLYAAASLSSSLSLSEESIREKLRLTLEECRARVPHLSLGESPQPRLFFTLDTADLIPECLESEVIPFRAEGKVTDIWDKGWTVFFNIYEPEKATGPPWALVLVGLLLSGEWLTRKLLRLA